MIPSDSRRQSDESNNRRGLGPIKVATLLSFPLGPGTGLGSYILGVAEALRQHPDFELLLIAPDDRERGGAGRRGSQLWLSLRQFVELRRLRPDVVHSHDHPALLAAAVAYRMVTGGSTRVIFTSHLDPVERRAIWKRMLLGRLLAQCSRVTVAAHDSIRKFDLLATPVPPREVVAVVPGAASVRIREKCDPAVVAFGASIGHSGGPMVLQVANFLFPAKVEGTLRLLEAFVKVRQHVRDAKLLLVGRGPLLDRVKETRDRLGLGDAVLIPGTFIEDLSLPLGLADLQCHITLQDACPISILEAMHAGKAVVASRTGGIPEIIEDGVTGVLVDDNPEHISRAIVDLLQQPERVQALGRRAQEVARSRFCWERVAADFGALWQGAAEVTDANHARLRQPEPVPVEGSASARPTGEHLPC